MPGDSGGPLLVLDEKGRWRLLGLQVAVTKAPAAGRATISLSLFGTPIEQLIAEANVSSPSGAEGHKGSVPQQ
jgi:hypothetical protein